jgi:hypothetical protein
VFGGCGARPIELTQLSRNSFFKSLVGLEICFFPPVPKLVLVGRLLRNSFCKSLVEKESGFFPSGQNLFWWGGSQESAFEKCS